MTDTHQGHLDRLTSVDAGFLHMEEDGAHMHIGAVGVFDGPAPSAAAFRAHIDARLPMLPRYRQRVQLMPWGTGRPVWVEDTTFRLDFHVRHTALPAPGGQEELLALVNRVLAQRLDRTKPLWEMWLVEGLEDGRWAVLNKTHHAMIDGVGGVDLLTVLFDLTPDDSVAPPPPAWRPADAPSSLDLLKTGAKGLVRNIAEITTRGAGMAVNPKEALRTTWGAVAALAETAKPMVDAAPRTPLNRKPGPHRSVAVVTTELADYKAAKSRTGATVNDVVLAAVAGALGTFLSERGMDVDGVQLRACVPVSMRPEDKKGAAGNEIAIMMAPLPVGLKDPKLRLSFVQDAMKHLKSSKQAEGAKVLTSIENALPPAILARASKLGFSSRLYNVLVTNVPGPQIPIYLLGRELKELIPLAFLAPEHTLAIGVMSYNGKVTYGLVADTDAVPDLHLLARYLEESLAELVATAT